MLKRIEKVIVELSISLVVCLFDYAPLDDWYWSLIVVITTVCSLGSIVHCKGLLLERSWLDYGGIPTAFTYQVVLHCEREGSCVASIHIIIFRVVRPKI